MSRFLFRLAAYTDVDEIEHLWPWARARGRDRFWINRTGRQAVLPAILLGDDPHAWWHGPGGGCIYIEGNDERAGCQLFFEIHADLFDRVEFEA